MYVFVSVMIFVYIPHDVVISVFVVWCSWWVEVEVVRDVLAVRPLALLLRPPSLSVCVFVVMLDLNVSDVIHVVSVLVSFLSILVVSCFEVCLHIRCIVDSYQE